MDLSTLSWQDLTRLRNAVRRVHLRHYPLEHCTTRECDRIIETLGEATAQKMLQRLVDGKLVDGKLAR